MIGRLIPMAVLSLLWAQHGCAPPPPVDHTGDLVVSLGEDMPPGPIVGIMSSHPASMRNARGSSLPVSPEGLAGWIRWYAGRTPGRIGVTIALSPADSVQQITEVIALVLEAVRISGVPYTTVKITLYYDNFNQTVKPPQEKNR